MEKLKDFLKPSKRKLVILLILFIAALISIGIKYYYSFENLENPNLIYLNIFLFGPFSYIEINNIVIEYILKIIWMCLVGYLIDLLYSYKKKSLIIVGIIFLVCILISFNVFSIPGRYSKSIFIEALQKNDISYCQKIPKMKEIKAEEIDNIMIEAKYPRNWIGFIPSIIGGFPMRDTCIQVIKTTTGMEAYTKAVDSGVTDMKILESLFPTN